MLPLYEAKMIHHYDTRWATYEPDGSTRLMTAGEKAARVLPMPRYWVHEADVDKKLGAGWDKSWFLGWRDIARATDERTVIATLLPRVAVGNQLPLALPDADLTQVELLQASLTSFVMDYVARQKAGGTHLNFFVFSQLPAPRPGTYVAGLRLGRAPDSWVRHRVESLNSWSVGVGERSLMRAELDAYCLHLYGVSREDADYLMETFTIMKGRDLKEYGAFRTKDVLMAAYDAIAVAIADGTDYVEPIGKEVTE